MSNPSWVEALIRESIKDRGYEGVTDEQVAKLVEDIDGDSPLSAAYEYVTNEVLERFDNDEDSPFEGIDNYTIVQFINKHGIAVDTFLPEHKLRQEYISCIRDGGYLDKFIAEHKPAYVEHIGKRDYQAPSNKYGHLTNGQLIDFCIAQRIEVIDTDDVRILRMRIIMAIRAAGKEHLLFDILGVCTEEVQGMQLRTFWDIVRVLEGKTIQTVNPYDTVDEVDKDGIVLTCTDGTKLVVAVDLEDSDGLLAWPFGSYERDKEDTSSSHSQIYPRSNGRT